MFVFGDKNGTMSMGLDSKNAGGVLSADIEYKNTSNGKWFESKASIYSDEYGKKNMNHLW